MISHERLFSANLETVTLSSIHKSVDNLIATGLKLPRELDVWLSPADFDSMIPDFQLGQRVYVGNNATSNTKMTYYVNGHELHLKVNPEVQLGTIAATPTTT